MPECGLVDRLEFRRDVLRDLHLHDLAADGMADALAMTAGPVMTHRSAGDEVVAAMSKRLSPSRAPQRPNYAAKRNDEPDFMRPRTLTDVLFRRLGVGWSGPMSEEQIAAEADRAAAALGWTPEQRDAEIRRFRSEWTRLYAPRGA